MPPRSPRPAPVSALVLLTAYSLAVAAASLLGGWLPGRVRLTHLRLQLAMSLVGGLMLGVALFQLLPHAAEAFGALQPALYGTAAGLLGMFFLIRFAPFHSHEPPAAARDAGHRHDGPGACGHPHHHPAPHPASWAGAVFGLSLHALIDGAAIGAAVRAAGQAAAGAAVPAGFGAALAVLLHKPLDGVTIATLLRTGGPETQRRATAVNVAYAALTPAGAFGFHLLAGAVPGTDLLTGTALALAAGAFICIALSDLLPELEFHAHDRFALSAALLVGVGLAAAVESVAHGGGDTHGGGHTHGPVTALDPTPPTPVPDVR